MDENEIRINVKNINCPFCGGEPIMMYQHSSNGIFGWIECQTCGGRTKTKRVYGVPGDPDFYDQFAYNALWTLWTRRQNEEADHG